MKKAPAPFGVRASKSLGARADARYILLLRYVVITFFHLRSPLL